jgi:hypothetical protein
LRWSRNSPIRIGLFSILAAILVVLLYSPTSGISAAPFTGSTPAEPGEITSEELFPPSIPIEEGSNAITAGVGLFGGEGNLKSDVIEFSVPQGADIEQVILYWAGREGDPDSGDAPDSPSDESTIQVNDEDVTGDKFAEVFLEGPNDIVVAYRADITSLDLVSEGENDLEISGDPFVNFLHDGAGIVVITDGDDTERTIAIRDGVDSAFSGASASEQQVTVPQTFSFPSADSERTAELTLFVSQVAERVHEGQDTFRTNNVIVEIGDNEVEFPNQLQSNDGLNWDTLTLTGPIPAGVDSLTVRIDSGSDAPIASGFTDSAPAAFQWIAAILTVTEAGGDDGDSGDDGDGDGGDGGDGGDTSDGGDD